MGFDKLLHFSETIRKSALFWGRDTTYLKPVPTLKYGTVPTPDDAKHNEKVDLQDLNLLGPPIDSCIGLHGGNGADLSPAGVNSINNTVDINAEDHVDSDDDTDGNAAAADNGTNTDDTKTDNDDEPIMALFSTCRPEQE